MQRTRFRIGVLPKVIWPKFVEALRFTHARLRNAQLPTLLQGQSFQGCTTSVPRKPPAHFSHTNDICEVKMICIGALTREDRRVRVSVACVRHHESKRQGSQSRRDPGDGATCACTVS